MGVDPLGTEPRIKVPTPGGSSAIPDPQTPAGFGEDTTPAPHTGLASPIPAPQGPDSLFGNTESQRGTRRKPFAQFSPKTQVALAQMARQPAVAWNDAQAQTLTRSLMVQDQTLTEGPRLNQIMNSVMQNTGPSILDLAAKKFERQVAMSTTEMFEERAFQRMIGYVDDDEAFSLAAGDLWMDTWGAVFTAGQVFTKADVQKTYFTEHWLGNQGTFNDLENEVTKAAKASWSEQYGIADVDQAGAWGAYTNAPGDMIRDARGALRELSGKGGAWAVEGNNLAIQFSDGEGAWNVLVRLRPGTTIETSADAVQAYALAIADAEHAIDPTSDDVAGPQALLGKAWEGLDNVIQTIERFGTSGTIPSLNDQLTAVNGAMWPGRRNPPIDGVDVDTERLRENIAGRYDEKATREAILTQIARDSTKDENTPMSHIVTAGLTGLAEIPDEVLADVDAESIDRLVEAAQQKQAETSYIGQFLQEDVFPPVLTALQAWESALQFIGVTALHLTTADEIAALGSRVAEEGLSALADPENLKLLPALNYEQIVADFNDIREVGLPAFTNAYLEAMEGRTMADEFDLEPGSAAWQATNVLGSIIVDPITYMTLGGNASWKGLSKTLTTVPGARQYVMRPHVVSTLRQLVTKDNTNILTLFISDGMESSSISRLNKILATTYTDDASRIAAIQEGQEVLFDSLVNGTWLPSGPARVVGRKTTLGLGQFFAHLGGPGATNQRVMRYAQDILARAPRQRFAAIGEREFLSDVSTRLTIMYGDDAARYAEKLDEAIGIYDAAKVGDQAIGVIQGQIQASRTRLTQLAAGITDDVKFVPTLRGNVKQMDDSIKALDDAIAGRVAVGDDATAAQLRVQRDQAIASRDESQRFLDELTPQYNDVNAAVRNEQKVLDRYLKTQEMLGTGERERGVLERYTHSLYDEWADNINQSFVERGWATADDLPIPIVEGQVHPWFPDLPMRNWSRVTGETVPRTYRTAQASNLEAFGATADDLRSIGMGAIAGSTRLPASPYELLAFTHTRPKVWEALHESAMARGFKELMDGIQTVWSAGVLLNPRTSVRSSLDEVIRFYEDSGLSTDALKAGYRSFPGTANLGGGVGPEARAFAREQLDNFLPSSAQAWEMVSPSGRGMWVHAERWVNGTLMNDPQFKAYARVLAEAGGDEKAARRLWEEWWSETGAKLSRRNTYSASSTRAGEPITAGNSFDIIGNSLDMWLLGAKNDAVRAEARSAMIEAASTNGIVNKQAAFWRQMGDVPGAVNIGGRGTIQPVESAFNLMYGSPQVRRGGVFYDHYYNFAINTYREGKGGLASEGGRILDADWLVNNGHAATRQQADNLISAGTRNETVRQIVSESGYVLEADLKNQAMRWAATQADNMMYTFGAGSILGKKMARIYPFGRAQVDYLQWWWKKLTQPTQWGLPGAPTARFAPTSPAGVPSPLGIVSNNVNVRLVDRMAHLLTVGEAQEPGEFEKPSALSPAGMIDNLTFLPSTLDHTAVMEIPSFGPLPGWMVNLPLDDRVPGWAGMRRLILETNPSLMQFTEPYEDYGDAILGLWDTIIPKSGLSVWNLGKSVANTGLLAAAYVTMGIDPEDPQTPEVEKRINAFVNSLIWEQETPYWRDQLSTNYAEWLTENGSSQVPDLNNEEWVAIQDGATLSALENNLNDTLGKIAGAAVQSGSDFQYTDALMPAIGYVEDWYTAGYISEAKRDSILIGHSLIDSGDASPRDRLVFADDVLDSLFTLLPKEERTEFIAENPGAAINFVSWYRVVPSLVPEYARAGVVGNRIVAPGEDGRELRQRGREDGWIVAKDPNEYMFEAHMSVHRAYRDRITDIYEETINSFIGADIKEALGFDPDRPIAFSKNTLDFAATTGPIPAGWWQEHGQWLAGVEGFNPPADAVAAWTAGESYGMSLGEFRGMFKDAKERYAYKYTDDTLNETLLRRLGDNDERPTRLAMALRDLEGFEDVPFDTARPMSYYGADLVSDLNDAVTIAEREFGWANPTEWEADEFTVENEDDTVTVYNLDEFRARFRTAVALSAIAPEDGMEFTQQDYEASQWSRWLGDINFEPPEPPPLDQTEYAHRTTPDRVRVIDGDTVEIMGDDGPVFLRLLGINAPEQGKPGSGRSTLGLMDLVDDAEEVSFAIWQPERYGRTQTFFTKEADAVTYRDRTFVWLYVDGVPIYDPTVFTPTNIRGVGTGGEMPDYQAMRERES